MKIYLFDCNYKNEYLGEIQTETPQDWAGCSTEVPYVQSNELGKSYAWNPDTQQWDTLIDDWRGITLYNKANSLLSKQGDLNPKPENFTNIVPPDTENKYVWNDDLNVWQVYVEHIDVTAIIKQFEDAIQAHIDNVAKARGYDNGYTCASYFEDKNVRYASDAQIFKDWRSDVWVAVNQILNSYQSQIGEMGGSLTPADLANFPTVESIIAQLPVIEWQEL